MASSSSEAAAAVEDDDDLDAVLLRDLEGVQYFSDDEDDGEPPPFVASAFCLETRSRLASPRTWSTAAFSC